MLMVGVIATATQDSYVLLSSLVSDGGGVSLLTVPDPDHTSVYSPVQASWTLQYTQLEYDSQTGEMSTTLGDKIIIIWRKQLLNSKVTFIGFNQLFYYKLYDELLKPPRIKTQQKVP